MSAQGDENQMNNISEALFINQKYKQKNSKFDSVSRNSVQNYVIV